MIVSKPVTSALGPWRIQATNQGIAFLVLTTTVLILAFLIRQRSRMLSEAHTDLVDNQKRLAESRDFAEAILDSVAPHIAILDRTGCIIEVNASWRQFAVDNGMPRDRVGLGESYIRVCQTAAAKDTMASIAADGIQAVLAGQKAEFTLEYPCHSADRQRWFQMRVRPLRVTDGGVVVSHDDITPLKTVEIKLQEERIKVETTACKLDESERFIRTIADNLPSMIGYVDTDCRYLFANRAYTEWFGRLPEHAIGISVKEMLGDKLYAQNEPFLQEALAGRRQAFERAMVRENGEVGHVWIQYIPDIGLAGLVKGIFVLATDITTIKQAEFSLLAANNELLRLSRIDGLTGAANRRWFDEVLETEWNRALRSSEPIGVLMIDIDLFKPYNDNNGHVVGDACLKSVVDAIARVVRHPPDMVARYGGEEFVCLLPGADLASTESVGCRILEEVRTLNLRHTASNVADHVTVSIGGVSMVPEAGHSPSAMVEAADRLLYKAKQEGRNRLVTC